MRDSMACFGWLKDSCVILQLYRAYEGMLVGMKLYEHLIGFLKLLTWFYGALCRLHHGSFFGLVTIGTGIWVLIF